MKKEDISILIVGLGSVGQRHLKNLHALGIRNISAVSRNTSLLNDDSFPDFKLMSDLGEALAGKPAAVVISNQTHLHMETALQSAKAGCHLFLEKPVTHSFEGMDELMEIVTAGKLIVQVGFQFRFHPVLRSIRNAIAQGEIGEIASVHAHWGEYLPGWHPWEDYRQSYSARSDMGGGVLLTLCHPFDYLRWLIGEITDVSAHTGTLSGLELDTEDTAIVTLKFTSGALGCVYVDYIERPPRHDITIIGQKGKIIWDNNDGSAKIFTPESTTVRDIPAPEDFERNDLFIGEISHFIQCLTEDQTPDCNLEDGLRALNIVLASKKSSASGETIKLNMDY